MGIANKRKEFAKNTFILMLGKICTQFISFLLIPLYTRRLETSDYGAVDLVQTYISLFVPLLVLRLDSAVFRFLIDERKNDDDANKRIIVTNAIVTITAISALLAVIYLFFPLFVTIKYYWLIFFNIISIMFSNILLQVARGIGRTKDYAIASIITGASIAITNLILILHFGFGAESILISSIVGNIICSIYIVFVINLSRYFHTRYLKKSQLKTMLKYSLPMIPNALSWWIVNVSDRTIISIILGTAANGIYTVSCKFSNVINSIFSIFNMSWQESASLHINDPDRDEFFTKMINRILFLFASGALMIMAMLPIIYNIVIGSQYLASYNYIPVLLYANVWSALNGLVGGIYVAKKRTKEIASTTIASAIINIAVDLLLIRFVGLYAATISTLVSAMAMAIYRTYDCKKYVNYKFNTLSFSVFTLLFIASAAAYHINNPCLNIVNLIIVAVYVAAMNRKGLIEIIKGLGSIKKKITHKKNG